MKYWKNNYAINKGSKDIIYKFVTRKNMVITKEKFLTENPNLTESDFNHLKVFFRRELPGQM